jgi:hypothetical protein
MISKKVKKIAKAQGWYKKNDGAFGLYKGFFCSISDTGMLSNPHIKTLSIVTENIGQDEKKLLQASLKDHQKRLRFNTFEIQQKVIHIQFQELWRSTPLKIIYGLLDFLLGIFHQNNITPHHNCFKCQANAHETDFYLNGENYSLYCNTCADALTEESLAIAQQHHAIYHKSYWVGFAGAFIFGTIMSVLWAVAANYLSIISLAIPFIGGYLAVLGYNKFKGKSGRYKKYILLLAHLCMVVLAVFLSAWFLMFRNNVPIKYFGQLLDTNVEFENFVGMQCVLTCLTSILVWCWLLFVYRDQAIEFKNAEKFQ